MVIKHFEVPGYTGWPGDSLDKVNDDYLQTLRNCLWWMAKQVEDRYCDNILSGLYRISREARGKLREQNDKPRVCHSSYGNVPKHDRRTCDLAHSILYVVYLVLHQYRLFNPCVSDSGTQVRQVRAFRNFICAKQGKSLVTLVCDGLVARSVIILHSEGQKEVFAQIVGEIMNAISTKGEPLYIHNFMLDNPVLKAEVQWVVAAILHHSLMYLPMSCDCGSCIWYRYEIFKDDIMSYGLPFSLSLLG